MRNGLPFILFLLICCLAPPLAAAETGFNPYRVLLVIGDQWEDPRSFLIDVSQSEGLPHDFTVRPPGTDLKQLVVMLKGWGVPFDIARLDQQRLDPSLVLGPEGEPLYGCILWAADPEGKILSQHWEVLEQVVERRGVSLVALADRVRHPVLERLLGLKFIRYNMTHDHIVTAGDHFLTRGLGTELTAPTIDHYLHRAMVEAAPGTTVLARQGPHPALTLRRTAGGGSAIWLGGDNTVMFDHQAIRTLLRRALAEAIGYSLHQSWENHKIMAMDDPGGAGCAWLDHWHYPTLTREQYREHLIEPLKKHQALLVINVVPGFANEETRQVELSFQQRFTDRFGAKQDFASTKLGLEEGVRAGVFELQSHGWTHMQPDLDSAPGPWWGAPLDGEKAEVGWYREFGDTRRGFVDIPAAEQRFRMRTGIKWIEHLFGTTPLSFVSGGGGVSTSYDHNTWIQAAREGFGWICWYGGYLGKDLAVTSWLYEGTAEAPATVQAEPDAHDKGIAERPKEFLRTFELAGPDAVWIGLNEWVGYLHAGWESRAGSLPAATLVYDDHYCRHFRDRKSSWQLELADWAKDKLAGKAIMVDGQAAGKVGSANVQEVAIPAGTGRHRIEIR